MKVLASFVPLMLLLLIQDSIAMPDPSAGLGFSLGFFNDQFAPVLPNAEQPAIGALNEEAVSAGNVEKVVGSFKGHSGSGNCGQSNNQLRVTRDAQGGNRKCD